MLARQKPINLSRFISITDSDLNKILQIEGFMPMYYYDKVFYYIKSEELEKIIEERR